MAVSNSNNEPLLDREFLERLERLTIHWQQSFNGLVGGHNRSRFAGGGQEFLDHRHFHDGDDLRAVNWRAYMRLDKMFLKMFQVEPRVPVRILLDTSASMTAGSGEKFLFAKRLCAALCYVGLVRLDTIQILPFSAKLREGKAAGGGRHRFRGAAEFLRLFQQHDVVPEPPGEQRGRQPSPAAADDHDIGLDHGRARRLGSDAYRPGTLAWRNFTRHVSMFTAPEGGAVVS